MGFIFKAIDHFQLASPKNTEDQSRKFFNEILMFREVDKPASLKSSGGVWFESGSIKIHVGTEDQFIPARKAHPALEVENLRDFKQHLITNRVSFTEDKRLPGANRIYISDPFGNRIEILEWI
ncbi:catechol 2,3-dioxygenase-like lactoylglutathione lyase family enzyme [Peribacillus simplex]|uniref:Glyoxalase n=1 Tax=Peribacillus simplex TaxID=1478 RepID=A0AAW7IIP0_9BACI|nr:MULTISPECIES: glyoxalase [Peribacillus]MDF9761054.1 catechol 2,3-dioxygenase-like lactoylglutathione lyase family enzyme [Peribacillus simplex]MDM5453339.1 glyoxalase [Peribacillus simplex]MDV7763663.1 glyoxalase [Peribacillus sp. CSMR9]